MRPRVYFLFVFLLTLAWTCSAQPFDGFIKFDGFDDALWIDSKDIIPENSDFTLEFWFKTCNDTGYIQEAIMGNGQDIEINFFLPPPNPNNFYQICAFATNGTYVCTQDHQFPSDDNWHHMAVTFDYYQSEFSYYYDGLYGPTAGQFDFEFVLVDTFFVGRGNHQRWLWDNFDGYIDEIRMSDTMRYINTFTPDTSAFEPDQRTIGLWHMNDSLVASTVLDASGNDRHFNVINDPHILIPVDSQRQALIPGDSWDSRSMSNGANRSQPQSNCRVPKTGFDVVILEQIDTVANDTTINDTSTLIKQISQSALDISLRPNPAYNELIVSLQQNDPIQYSIVNINGRVVQSGVMSKHNSTIDISGISEGLYLFSAESSESTNTVRFVKMD